MRALAIVLLLGLFGCGGDDVGPEPHTLRILASDGSAGGAIDLAAVTSIDVVFDPPGNAMLPPMQTRFYDGMNVQARVTAAGEWLLSMNRTWVVDNAFDNSSTFGVDVPLTHGGRMETAPRPQMRVIFRRETGSGLAIIADHTVANYGWPLEPGGETIVVVGCQPGSEDLCSD